MSKKKKNYFKIQKTKRLVQRLKPYWKKVEKLQGNYWKDIHALEKQMSKNLKIKDLEIFHCDGEAVGIGNYSRTMPLIHDEELKN
jgi:hypothetical protein